MEACRMEMGRGRSSAGGASADRNSLQAEAEGRQVRSQQGRPELQTPWASLLPPVLNHSPAPQQHCARRRRSPEIWVRAVCQLVDALLQGAAGPVDGEVDVLEQHPAAVLVRVRQVVHRNRLLHRQNTHTRSVRGHPSVLPAAGRLSQHYQPPCWQQALATQLNNCSTTARPHAQQQLARPSHLSLAQ